VHAALPDLSQVCKDKKVGFACSFSGPVLTDYYQIMSDRSPELVQ
jgi:hypothetical protein